MWEMFDFGHKGSIKELRETMNRLLKETDEENFGWLSKSCGLWRGEL